MVAALMEHLLVQKLQKELSMHYQIYKSEEEEL